MASFSWTLTLACLRCQRRLHGIPAGHLGMGGGLTTMAEEDGGGMLESSWISSDRLVSVCDAVQVLVPRYLGVKLGGCVWSLDADVALQWPLAWDPWGWGMAGLSGLIVIGSINTRHGVGQHQDSQGWTELDLLLFSLRWTPSQGSLSFSYKTTAERLFGVSIQSCRQVQDHAQGVAFQSSVRLDHVRVHTVSLSSGGTGAASFIATTLVNRDSSLCTSRRTLNTTLWTSRRTLNTTLAVFFFSSLFLFCTTI